MAVTKLNRAWAILTQCFACATAEASRDEMTGELESAIASLAKGTVPPSDVANSEPTVEVIADDPSLRRSYGVRDLKVHPCATADEDGTITGTDCPAALVVFGPYVSAPANSDVRLQFDIESSMPLKVNSDVISNGAKQFHGEITDQFLRPGTKQTINYRLRLFEATRSLETRIGITAEAPADFRISDLKLSVK